MKLSPEERKEKRKEVNRQYQLKNKEVLKEKRKEYEKRRLQNVLLQMELEKSIA